MNLGHVSASILDRELLTPALPWWCIGRFVQALAGSFCFLLFCFSLWRLLCNWRRSNFVDLDIGEELVTYRLLRAPIRVHCKKSFQINNSFNNALDLNNLHRSRVCVFFTLISVFSRVKANNSASTRSRNDGSGLTSFPHRSWTTGYEYCINAALNRFF